jgi:apolipoprotein D and lipocalin family protein
MDGYGGPAPITVDLERYQGTWYEIGSIPQPFQAGCTCTEANYKLNDDGTVQVVNSCYRNNRWESVTGAATVDNPGVNTDLTVTFPGSDPGDYRILAVADDYSYVVVTSDEVRSLWILARERQLDDESLEDAMTIASANVDLNGFTFTVQSGCEKL